jgi:glycosyltransferase involved in cell wall biosynthesis
VWSLRRTLLGLRAQLEEHRPEVVLTIFDLPTLFTGMAVGGRKKDYRWIARLALAVDRPSFSLLDSLSRPLLHRAYRRVDHFVANSQGLAGEFAKKHRFAAGRISAIHNPVDIARLESLAAESPAIRRDEHRPLLVWVGRLHRQKRPDVLLDAYVQLRNELQPQLWILGEGPLRPALERRIAAEGWQDDVRLMGFQANPFPFVRQADLFLLTSDFEGLPNALLEAQALGIPAVATRARFGPEEIIQDNITGRLVPCGDAKAMAAACGVLLTNAAHLQACGQAARQRIAESFAAGELIRKWEAVPLARD